MKARSGVWCVFQALVAHSSGARNAEFLVRSPEGRRSIWGHRVLPGEVQENVPKVPLHPDNTTLGDMKIHPAAEREFLKAVFLLVEGGVEFYTTLRLGGVSSAVLWTREFLP